MDERQTATVLAALRHFQKTIAEEDRHGYYDDHYHEVTPLSDAEIDDLCETINTRNGPDQATEAAAAIRAIVSDLKHLGFGFPDAPISGADTVDVVNKYFEQLRNQAKNGGAE